MLHDKTSNKRFIIQHAKFSGMFVRPNFVDIYLQGMCDRGMRSGTELAREIMLTDWSIAMAGNLSNRPSGVQISCDIFIGLKRYLYSAKCSWI